MDEQIYHATNPLVNDEDLADHSGVGIVLGSLDRKILVFFHKKYNFWTIPIGKIPHLRFSEKVVSLKKLWLGAKRELREELGINVELYKIGSFLKTYHRGAGVFTTIDMHLFKSVSSNYDTKPINKEPEKHICMSWMTEEELKKSGERISDATKFYFALMKILADESVQLIHSLEL